MPDGLASLLAAVGMPEDLSEDLAAPPSVEAAEATSETPPSLHSHGLREPPLQGGSPLEQDHAPHVGGLLSQAGSRRPCWHSSHPGG